MTKVTPYGTEKINDVLHRRNHKHNILTPLSAEEMTQIIEVDADWMEKARARLDQLEHYQSQIRAIANHTPCVMPDDEYSVFSQKPIKKWFTWFRTIGDKDV